MSNSTRSAPAATAASQRRERVLGRDRRRAAVADRRAAARPRAPEVHVVLITTIAQSSPSSPPAKARHAATTASAISCAGCAGSLGEQRVEPLAAEELARRAAPRSRRRCRGRPADPGGSSARTCSYVCARVDAEREAAAAQSLDACRRAGRAAARDARRSRRRPCLAGSTVRYAIVMNLPTAISPTTTSFACARKSDGSGCSRASERKTNFAIAMSAVASIPCPVTSPSTTASRPSGSSRKSKTSPPTSTCAADS